MISGLDWRRGISDQVNREGHAPWYLQWDDFGFWNVWIWKGNMRGNTNDLRAGNANDLRAFFHTKIWNSRQRDPAYFAGFDGLR